MLKDICVLNGTSGREEKVREYIISHLPENCEYRVDPLGNVICNVKGKNTAKK